MLKHLTVKGLLLGIVAGLLVALFDSLFMLMPNLYVPYSYPLLLITLNPLFWMTVGGLSGLLLWLFVRKRKKIQGKENFYWVISFLVPFALLYGLVGRFYIPLKVWTFMYGPPIYDHHLSFLWVSLLLIFLAFYFRKMGNTKELSPIFFSFEIVTVILLYQFCSNLLYMKVPGIYDRYQYLFQAIRLGRDLFLIVVYGLGVLTIVGFYFITCFKIRPVIKGNPGRHNYRAVVMLFFIVAGCLAGLYTWSHKRHSTQTLHPVAADKDRKAGKVPYVILIVLDTVRADRLSMYGTPGVTENLEEFSRDALVFENCVASSSWTIPSHASLFTGLYPTEHGSHGILDPSKKTVFGFAPPAPLSDEFMTLAEIFRESGYITAAKIANFIVLRPELKLDQGFQLFDKSKNIAQMYISYPFRPSLYFFCYLTNIYPEHTILYRRADEITRQSIHLLEEFFPSPIFLFINYLDAHLPYGPPRPFAGNFLDTSFPQIYRLKQHYRRYTNKIAIDEKSWLSYLLSQYDGELAYLDDQLGIFFSRLKKMGLYDSSLIIITSDHGELFGEHGFFRHQGPMYEGVVKIPLLIKLPYSKRVGREKRMITLADLFPTILSICELPIPAGVSGQAFGDASSPVVSEFYEYEAGKHQIIYDGKYKYMAYEHKRGPELYDLASDPMETENLVEKLPEIALAMEKRLRNWIKEHGPKYTTTVEREGTVSKGVMEGLKALGYIE